MDSTGHSIRPFRADDLVAVSALALARATLGSDAPSAARLTRDFVLDPGFAPLDLLVAEQSGRIVGYVLAPRLRPPALVDDAELYRVGWIAGLGVRADCRRHGIATALVERSLALMAGEGARRVDVADFPGRYLVPGIDRAAGPAAYALFVDRLGFQVFDQVASMGVELAAAAQPPTGDGAGIRRLDYGEIPVVRDAVVRGFGWSWWLYIERSLNAYLAGDQTPVDVFVAWSGDDPVGFVHGRGARFGPLGVLAPARGAGLGGQLTRMALARMRMRGLGRAYFLIATADVEAFYTRLGFTVLRRFERLRRALTP